MSINFGTAANGASAEDVYPASYSNADFSDICYGEFSSACDVCSLCHYCAALD